MPSDTTHVTIVQSLDVVLRACQVSPLPSIDQGVWGYTIPDGTCDDEVSFVPPPESVELLFRFGWLCAALNGVAPRGHVCGLSQNESNHALLSKPSFVTGPV